MRLSIRQRAKRTILRNRYPASLRCFKEEARAVIFDCSGKRGPIQQTQYAAMAGFQIVQQIVRFHAIGYRIPQIIALLDSAGIHSPGGKPKWCTGSVDAILTNRKYTGVASVFLSLEGERPRKTTRQKRLHCNEYRMSEANPVIISEELYEQVQSVRNRKAKAAEEKKEDPDN